ncbi:hypothetical protein KBD45_04775 [Candidatus Dojkabacteria bacterium]|nr:hypothetical protein [Candidatus Dojkabacteria bacterium]
MKRSSFSPKLKIIVFVGLLFILFFICICYFSFLLGIDKINKSKPSNKISKHEIPTNLVITPTVIPSPTNDPFLKDIRNNGFVIDLNTLVTNYSEYRLYSNDGTFLGKVNTNRYDTDSICNKYGYGSKYEKEGILNKYSDYGSKYNSESPFNEYSSTPPMIYDGGNLIAYLTTNKYKEPRIDPYQLIEFLIEEGCRIELN